MSWWLCGALWAASACTPVERTAPPTPRTAPTTTAEQAPPASVASASESGDVAPSPNEAAPSSNEVAPSSNEVAPSPSEAVAGFTCAARMTAARAELLAAGFSPAEDTPHWLQVRGHTDGGLTLNVYTVYTPDGDGLRTYDAEIHPYKGKPFAWRLKQQSVLDEFKEERLPERTWTRAQSGWTAKIHTRTEESKWVALFESAVRPALEDCLAHPGEQGKLERCEYSEQEREWLCKTW